MKDRIDRAFEIIVNGQERGEYNGRWFVQSQTYNYEYEVGVFFCECEDARTMGNICKHQLAGPAKLVTLACVSFRQDATSETELRQLGFDFAPKLATVPASYVAIARNEYKKQLAIFRAADAGDSPIEIRIKAVA